MIHKKNHNLNIFALGVSIYLINSFYFKDYVLIQQLLVWGTTGLFLFFNINVLSSMFNKCAIRKKISEAALFFILFVLFSILSPIAHLTFDFSFLSTTFLKLLSGFVYSLVPAVIIFKDNRIISKFDSYLLTFSLSMACYVVGSLIIYFIPSLRDVIISSIYMSEKDLDIISYSYYATRFGWAGLSSFTTSMKCVLGIAFLQFLLIKYIDNKKDIFGCIVLVLLLLIGCFMYARTGALIGLIAILMGLFNIFSKFKRIKKIIKYIIIIVVVFIAIAPFFYDVISNNHALSWMFELLINYKEGYGFVTDSSDGLLKMYDIKIKFDTFLIGDGFYIDKATGGYYMKNDIGFVRMILYFGIFGLITQYLTFVAPLIGTIKQSKNSLLKMLSISLIIILLLFEMKGETWVTMLPYTFSLFLLLKGEEHKAYENK